MPGTCLTFSQFGLWFSDIYSHTHLNSVLQYIDLKEKAFEVVTHKWQEGLRWKRGDLKGQRKQCL